MYVSLDEKISQSLVEKITEEVEARGIRVCGFAFDLGIVKLPNL